MKIKNRYLITSFFACSIVVLVVSGLYCSRAEQKPATSTLEVAKGERLVVEKSMALKSLTIGEGASLVAPEGKSLTMTVFGVGKTIKPGDYKGDIILNVNDSLIMQPSGNSMGALPMEYRTAILIDNGKYIPGKSVPAVVQGGKVTDKAITGVSILSTDEGFNGIVVKGNSEYTINDVNIRLEGNRGNDFIGYGAGITCVDNAKVTINNSDIHLAGITRCAFHGGGNSVTTLNNCRISNISPDSDKHKGRSFVAFWQLPLIGTNRSTQCCDNATIYYNNCQIVSNGWGVCSIDGGKDTRMYFKDSTLELKGARSRGYGAFSIGKAFVSYDHCTVSVNGAPLLIGGHGGMSGLGSQKSDGEITNGTIINSPLYGVVIFKCEETELKVNKGSIFNTGSSAFVVKGANAFINIDNAKLNPINGVILQLMDSDDTGHGTSRFIPPIGEVDKAIPGRDLTAANSKEDIFMTLSNMEVKGNFYNSTTNLMANCRENGKAETADWPDVDSLMVPTKKAESAAPAAGAVAGAMKMDKTALQGAKNLDLKFANVKVNGVISAATQAYKEGVTVIDLRNCEEISNVTQTAHEPVNNGVIVSFDKDCVWTVAGTSYLTSLTVANGAVIKAPDGKSLTMTVDGVQTPVKAGTYRGKIVIKVS